MWILPSRLRPLSVGRLIRAWNDTGASTPLVLRVDNDDPSLDEYRASELPPGWTLVRGERMPLGELYNSLYRILGPQDWYGFIADDAVPETKAWDRALIATADCHGVPGMAVPSGGETTGGCPHFVIAASLVREQGWLCLPGLDRLYIDTTWGEIAKAKGVYRERPDVVLSHRHFSNRLALRDATYRKHRKTEDRALFEAWLTSRKETA